MCIRYIKVNYANPENMDPENLRNFQIQLSRHYPHVYGVSQLLADDYTHALTTVGKDGYLEIEATFGKISYDANGNKRFNHDIPSDIMCEIVNILSSFCGWSSISDWFLVYDYEVGPRKRVRVSYENKTQQITCVHKKPMFRRDVGYREAKEDSHEWKLRDFITRINTKFEARFEHPLDELLVFSGVRASLRKYFVTPSSIIPGISWRMELIQTWTGTTLAEVEAKMTTAPPVCSFECEIVNLPQVNTLNQIQKLLLFSSLMLKMQDLLDIPACAADILKKNQESKDLPAFHFI